ncbi:S8 family serine peptidase [Mycoplasma procyoni]|uniref:S8 family serine peptidase n=1 Tax=Mycoplasma procyoni TaxID=568784 RepID=UPI00197B263D|nr:S8 family serine peptidase [Mycoplasma procyoni]MBN3535036.1 S8 family serine peptidase [Mycoplasma procyoni]
MKKNKLFKILGYLGGTLTLPLFATSFSTNFDKSVNYDNAKFNINEVFERIYSFNTKGVVDGDDLESEIANKFIKSLPKNKQIIIYTDDTTVSEEDNLTKIKKTEENNKKFLENLAEKIKDDIIVSSFFSSTINLVWLEVKEENIDYILNVLKKESITNFEIKEKISSISEENAKKGIINTFCLDKVDNLGNCTSIYKKPVEIKEKTKNYTFKYNAEEIKKYYKKQFEVVKDDFSETNISISSGNSEPINTTRTKVAIWEGGQIKNSDNFEVSKIKVINFNDDTSYDIHKTNVASIVGGLSGIDTFAKLYDVNQKKWVYQRKDNSKPKVLVFDSISSVDNLVKELIANDVDLVNGSFGIIGNDEDFYPQDYDNFSYYLDIITKKFKILFIFASGNEGQYKKNNKLDSFKNNFNNIVVGSVNTDNYKEISSFSTKESSSFYFKGSAPGVTITAPGTLYNFKEISDISGLRRGTSYSTPLVTGVISKLIRNNSVLKKNPISILSIIGVSSTKFNEMKKDLIHGTGYSESFGSGVINYKDANAAVKNLKVYNIPASTENGELWNTKSEEIFLSKGDNLTISSAWYFNGFKDYENSSLLNFKKNGQFFKDKLENKSITDFDIILEKWNESSKTWTRVERTLSSKSNKEILEHKASESGKYRFYIYKFSSSQNRETDQIAVSYLVKNEK